MRWSDKFPRYQQYSPEVPVYQISPQGTSAIHRFYDSSPMSPSGRYLTYTEFDFEDRLPAPGDEASVVVIDLLEGAEVYRTRTLAWDTQLGAQAQWGSSDDQLFFNRMAANEWRPFGVKVNLKAATEQELQGPVYMVSPGGDAAISPSLTSIFNIQAGYGVVVPPGFRRQNAGAPADDGLFVTDISSGETRLAVSLRDIYQAFPEVFRGLDLSSGGFYGFHTKWSPDGSRIMFVVRWRPTSGTKLVTRNWLITMDSSFGDLQVALTDKQWEGGHHPNWCPDGIHIVMNLSDPQRLRRFARPARFADRVARRLHVPGYRPFTSLRFARFAFDGSNMEILSRSHLGSGHPTWHSKLDAVLSDAYPWEPVAAGDGTSPIRLLSVRTDLARELVRVHTWPSFMGPAREWRVDPHPAWNYQNDAFVFNGYSEGVRAVFVADMSGELA